MNRLIHIILSLALLAGGLAYAAKPRKSDRLSRDRQQASQQVDQTRRDMRLNQEQLSQTLDELYAIEARIDSLNKQMGRIKGDIAVCDDSISRLNDSITTLTAEIDIIKGSLGGSLRDSRSRRQSMSSLGMVVSSKSFNDGMRRMSYIRQLDRSRVRKANSLAARRAQLQASQDRLAAMRQRQQGLLATLDAQQTSQKQQQAQAEDRVAILRHNHRDLDNELKRRQKRVNSLTTQLDRALAQEEAERKAEAERLAEEQARAEAQRQAEEKAQAEAQRKADEKAQAQADKKQEEKDAKPTQRGKRRSRTKPAPQQSSQSSQSSQKSQSSKTQPKAKFADSKGALPYPLNGEKKVIGFFGRSQHRDLSKIEIDNPGIEIQGKAGAQAVAVFDGQVAGVFYIDGLHNAVLIRHGDYITVYANIDTPTVKKGDSVRAGQQLGVIYSDEGKNPVLHFEIRKEKEKLNPMDWIK